jgi:hypothetical protein
VNSEEGHHFKDSITLPINMKRSKKTADKTKKDAENYGISAISLVTITRPLLQQQVWVKTAQL